ncbi:ras-related GTP-binding protein B-like, partial [Tursiops truncatus]|uniref:Ras-related GTP-binding protein n=1 Tax=Tursiops truncatus TaxID=9739 RepID=A0A6J3QV54_TURTR
LECLSASAHRQGSLAWKFTTLSPVFPASGNSNKQVISHYQCKEQRDVHRFEKISNIIKQFKLSCSKLAASFQSMEVRNSNFAAFIDIFTSNTYVMVVMSDPSIPSAATLINIRNARKHFEKLERVDGPKQCLLMR